METFTIKRVRYRWSRGILKKYGRGEPLRARKNYRERRSANRSCISRRYWGEMAWRTAGSRPCTNSLWGQSTSYNVSNWRADINAVFLGVHWFYCWNGIPFSLFKHRTGGAEAENSTRNYTFNLPLLGRFQKFSVQRDRANACDKWTSRGCTVYYTLHDTIVMSWKWMSIESGERIKIEEPLSTQTNASPSFLLLISKKIHVYLSCGSISNVQTLLQYMTSHYEITPHAQQLPTSINSSHHQPTSVFPKISFWRFLAAFWLVTTPKKPTSHKLNSWSDFLTSSSFPMLDERPLAQ